jgi:His/Glu/Gln/Arg/opine family amino acid ABC transporter permease subunit
MAFLDLQGYGWLLVTGAKLTILVGLCSMAIAILLGLIGAWGKLARTRPANALAGIYTTVVRGVPELVMILLVYYGVPTLIQDISALMGAEVYIDMNPFIAGVLTIGFIYGAFSTEVFRGAYMAVDKGQVEAAKACGMGKILAFRRVLLPQMWRFALPGLGNVWMVLIKATALISVIQLAELMRNADIAARATRLPFTFYFLASLVYLTITIASMLAQQRLERWADKGVRRA